MQSNDLSTAYAEFLDRATKVGNGITLKLFRPNGPRIMVKRLPDVQEIGLIQLPGNAYWRRNSGVVVAIPEDCPCPYALDDLVFFTETKGREVELEGVTYEIFQFNDEFGGDIIGSVSRKALDAAGISLVASSPDKPSSPAG